MVGANTKHLGYLPTCGRTTECTISPMLVSSETTIKHDHDYVQQQIKSKQ